jgi:ABC-2 type transport system permease protein
MIIMPKLDSFKHFYRHHVQRCFCWQRLVAVITKEFIQLRRDRLTFAITIMIPLMQLILFGYAINTNPKHLPTVVIDPDKSAFTRAFLVGLKNTDYFKITQEVKSEAAAKKMLQTGRTQFVVTIPVNFTRDLLRGKHPQLLIEADATDPVATGSALAAASMLATRVFDPLIPTYLKPNLSFISASSDPNTYTPLVNVVTHANYNPESITRYNIVPGLLGVVLTMTMVIIASLCLTREYEKGTIEYLLSTPVNAIEVMLGKIAPFIILAYIQVSLILSVAYFLFHIPMYGSLFVLLIAVMPFIAANLAVGLTFSSFARTQLQASQMAIFFFLPSLLLSGFMFPFRGMPEWAQYIGSILPLTYFLRITRGIMLKENSLAQIWPNLWPIMVFMVVALGIGLTRFRRTLD